VNSPGAPSSDQSDQQSQKPIEILLIEKNRHLQNENTQVKNKLGDLQTKYEAVYNENSNLSRMNVEQKGLIVELEKDLLKLAKNQKETSESELPENIEKELIASNQQPNEDMSLFNIVSNQRERFRQRVQELEGENLSNKQQITFLTNEIDRLRSDNVKLYEKIKFVKTFSGDVSNDTNSNNVMNKYTHDYESNLDPFAKFTRSERQKRYTDLKLHDKFTLSFGRFILSSKLARLIFCGYIFVVHLLIFLSLYHMAHHDASYRDFSHECSNSYRDHMHKVHGDKHFMPPK
jgi:homeobox protein cut-like